MKPPDPTIWQILSPPKTSMLPNTHVEGVILGLTDKVCGATATPSSALLNVTGGPTSYTLERDSKKEFNMAILDWSQCPAVESVPGKVSGAWVLRGTRMPVATIFENIEAGANIDDIMEWFDGLDREQVKAVIEFAARSLDTPAPVHH